VREKREKAGNGKMDKKKEQRSFEKRVHDQFVREKREKAGNGKMNKKKEQRSFEKRMVKGGEGKKKQQFR